MIIWCKFIYSGELNGTNLKGNKLMSNRCLLFLLILSVSFGYNPSPQKTPYSAQINTPVQKTDCGTESSPFNAQSPQEFHEPINSRTNRDVEIPINYHVIYVAGDSIFMNVTVDNVPYDHCTWDIRDNDNNTFLLYPGFGFDYPGHSYSLGGVLPPIRRIYYKVYTQLFYSLANTAPQFYFDPHSK
jgi:hypothetical protein